MNSDVTPEQQLTKDTIDYYYTLGYGPYLEYLKEYGFSVFNILNVDRKLEKYTATPEEVRKIIWHIDRILIDFDTSRTSTSLPPGPSKEIDLAEYLLHRLSTVGLWWLLKLIEIHAPDTLKSIQEFGEKVQNKKFSPQDFWVFIHFIIDLIQASHFKKQALIWRDFQHIPIANAFLQIEDGRNEFRTRIQRVLWELELWEIQWKIWAILDEAEQK